MSRHANTGKKNNKKKNTHMITYSEPNVSDTGRYSVTETCNVLGIHRNTLRRYTDQGLIKCGFRKQTARKFYAGREILKFWRAQL